MQTITRVGKSDMPGRSVATTTFTTDEPAGTSVGDLMLWKIPYNNNSSPLTSPAGWNVWGNGNTTALGFTIFYRFKQAGDPSSWSFTGTSFRYADAMESWRGVDPTTPQDVAVPTATTGTSGSTMPAITPVTAGAIILADAAFVAQSTGITSTTWATTNLDALTNNYNTITSSNNVFGGAGYEDDWVSGSYTPNMTHSPVVSSRFVGITSALRPAPDLPTSSGKFFQFL